MTRDPLDLLRAADPVPHPVAYPEDEVARRVARILQRDGETSLLLEDAPEAARPRWLLAGLAAAAVLVLAVVSAVVVTRHHTHTAAGATPVTCAVSTSGGARAVRDRLAQAETAIDARVRQLGGTAHTFRTDATRGTVGFTPTGISITKAARACRVTTTAIRPVIARPVDLDTHAPRAADPLAALTFTVPTTEGAYARLSPAHRSQLAAAMSHYNCTGQSAPTAAGLTCVGGYSQVLLVGPAVVSGPDVRSATISDAGVVGGAEQWTVQLDLQAAAAARVRAFTAAHHAGAGAGLEACGAQGATPCSDFLAYIVDARLDSVPVTEATLSGTIRLTGALDKFSAQQLAADYTAASVQLRPR